MKITLDLEPSEFRQITHLVLEGEEGTIEEFFAEFLRPMLITIGYAAGSIVDGCKWYAEEFEFESKRED